MYIVRYLHARVCCSGTQCKVWTPLKLVICRRKPAGVTRRCILFSFCGKCADNNVTLNNYICRRAYTRVELIHCAYIFRTYIINICDIMFKINCDNIMFKSVFKQLILAVASLGGLDPAGHWAQKLYRYLFV